MKNRKNLIYLLYLFISLILSLCLNIITFENNELEDVTYLSSHKPSNPIMGWPVIAELNPKFIVLGEIHGTRESPLFFGELISSLALQDKKILIAVELNASNNSQIQVAWRGDHTKFKNRLKAAVTPNRNDGVTSIAMFEMLSKLHNLKERDYKLSLVAFNGFANDDQRNRLYISSNQKGHEKAQAENIISAANLEAFDYILILVGESHARKNKIDFNGNKFKSMAMHLEEAGTVVSLLMTTSGGSAWNCILKEGVQPKPQQPITSDMIKCGNHSLKGLRKTKSEQVIGLGRILGSSYEDNYDGYYWLGPVSGSSPVK